MRVAEPDLAGDLDAAGLGLHALELDAVIELDDVDAVEHAEEVEVPPRAAELAVGRELQAGIGLAHDELGDRRVLGVAQRLGVDAAGGEARAGLLERLGAEEAADDVGAERRC